MKEDQPRFFNNSEELCKHFAEKSDTALLSFSMGKDSIGAYIQMRRYFKKIVPVYFYLVPDLDFIDDMIKYYEDILQTHIYRMPSPNLYNMLRTGTFQDYDRRINKIPNMQFAKFTREHALSIVRLCYLNDNQEIFTGVGVRASDNLVRQTTVRVHGVVNYKKKQFFPIFDWKQNRLVEEIEESGIKLPNDYHIWGCSFDGLQYKFIKGVHDNYPEDYKKIKEWFPLIDVELLRYKFREKYV